MSCARSLRYDVAGIPIVLESNVGGILDRVAETYSAFTAEGFSTGGALVMRLERVGERFLLSDSDGLVRTFADEHSALLGTLDRISQLVIQRLAAAGTLAVHAAAAVHRGRAIIMAGPSGSGKTTLALSLVSRGLSLLSDEIALIPPEGRKVLPYRRSVHVRPGTPELVPELAFLSEQPQFHMGGGINWSVTPQELERAMPGCLGGPAPLRHVLLLEDAAPGHSVAELLPVGAGVAAVELLRSTPAAERELPAVLHRLSGLLADCRCARLRPGSLNATLDLVMSWLRDDDL